MQLLSFSHPVILSSHDTPHLAGKTFTSPTYSITSPVRQDHFMIYVTQHTSRDFLKEWATDNSPKWPYSQYTTDEMLPHLPYPLLWKIKFTYVDPTYTPSTGGAADVSDTNPQTYIHTHILPGPASYHTHHFNMPRTHYINGIPHYLKEISTIAQLTSREAHEDFDYNQHGECVTVSISEESK